MRSPVFGMGTILANFQAAGNLPVVRDKLKIFVTPGTIEGAAVLSILADIASAPVHPGLVLRPPDLQLRRV